MDSKAGELPRSGTPLWHRALQRYREELDENDDYQCIIEDGCQGTFLENVEAIESLVPKDRSALNAINRLGPILKAVDDFSAAIAVCFGASAKLTAFVWGSIRLLLTLAATAGEILQDVIEMLEELSLTLPRFERYERTLTIDSDFENALIDVYAEVICFYARTIHFFRSHPHLSLRKRAWADISGDFHRTIRRIKHLSALVEKQADYARMRCDRDKYGPVLHVVDAMNDNRSLSATTLRYWHVPREANQNFYGGDDALQAIHQGLERAADFGGLNSFALHGMGGIGKTELSLQYARRNKARYDAVLWVAADNVISMGQSFMDLATTLQLGLSEEEGQDPIVATLRVKHWLLETDLRWLLVFDNADNLNTLQHAWPLGASGSILITSRDPNAARRPASGGLQVMPFNEVDASALLLKLVGLDINIPSNRAQAASISQALGGLPLAIMQIGGFISQRRLPLAEFLPLYRRNAAKIDVRKTSSSDYKHTLGTVWDMALSNLEGNASRLQMLLGFMSPDAVDEEILREGSALVQDEDFEFLGDEMDLGDAEETLLQMALLNKNIEDGSLSVHRLIQDAIIRRLSQAEKAAYLDLGVQILTWGFPERWSEDEGHQVVTWARCQKCLPHVVHLAGVATRYPIRPGNAQLYGELLLRTSWYLYEREQYTTSQSLVIAALDMFADQESLQYAGALDLLGLIDLDLNSPAKALEVFKRANAIREKADTPDEARRAFGLVNNALAYTEMGELDKAFEVHQEAIDIRLRLNSPRIGNSYSNMSSLLLRMGRADEAEEMLKRCPSLQDFTDETFIKTGNPRFSGDMVLLSRIRVQQGRFDEALRLASKALAFRQKLLGSRLKTCDSLYDVAGLLHREGKSSSAIELLSELAAISESLAEGEGQLARAHFKLAVIKAEMKRTDESKSHEEKATELWQKLHPRDYGDFAFDEACFSKLCLWMLW